MLALLVYVLHSWRKDRKRRRDVVEALTALSFAPLSWEGQIPFGWDRRGAFKDGYQGIYNGCRAIVVESEFCEGDSTYRQMFVAVERPNETPWQVPHFFTSVGLEYTQEGRWIIGTISKQTLGPEGIVGYLQCFS